jgi:hypothetical protein
MVDHSNVKPMTKSLNTDDSREADRFRSRSLRAAALGLGATTAAGESAASVLYDLSSSYSSGQTFSLDGTAFGEIELVLAGMAGMLDLSLDAPVAVMMGDSSTVEFAFFSSGAMMATSFLDALSVVDTVDGSLAFTPEAFLADAGVTNPAWAPGSTASAGFTFDPTGSLPLYGWLQLDFDASGTDFTVGQWPSTIPGTRLPSG